MISSEGLFIGLPAEFSPPEAAAGRLAKLATRAEREAYWLRIPEPWRFMIGNFAALFIGLDIVELQGLDERRKAIEEVPGVLRADVEWRVRHLWGSKEIREMSGAEFRARYPVAWQREAA